MAVLTLDKRVSRLRRWGGLLKRALGYKTETHEEMVDKCGLLKAAISPLKAAEKALRDQLADLGGEEIGTIEINGELYRATVSTYENSLIDWEELACELGATKEDVLRYTRKPLKTDVRVKALISS